MSQWPTLGVWLEYVFACDYQRRLRLVICSLSDQMAKFLYLLLVRHEVASAKDMKIRI
jgi:hypothetical protein